MQPHGTTSRALDYEKPGDSTPWVREAQSGISMELSESGSDSQATQMMLGTTEELVLGFLGCSEVRDNRFLLSTIPDTAVCKTRGRVGTIGQTLSHGPEERGRRRELWQVTTGRRESGLLSKQLTHRGTWFGWKLWLECREGSCWEARCTGL